MGKLNFIRQMPPHRPCPDTARPRAHISGDDVLLSYDEANTEAPVQLIFRDVFCCRVGNPNDEGFFGGGKPGIINDSIYNWTEYPKLEFGEFYEVFGFDWSNGLVGEGNTVVQPALNTEKALKHFVFFMKDGTFECVCRRWESVH